MTYTIKVKEICEGKFEIEADSREEALEMMEDAYWHDPNAYVLEAKETSFE